MRWRTFIAFGVIIALADAGWSHWRYASADQVSDMNKRQIVQYVLLLDREMCQTPTYSIRQQIVEALGEYYELTGAQFPLPLRCVSEAAEREAREDNDD